MSKDFLFEFSFGRKEEGQNRDIEIIFWRMNKIWFRSNLISISHINQNNRLAFAELLLQVLDLHQTTSRSPLFRRLLLFSAPTRPGPSRHQSEVF